jgi:hypothetical protein
MVSDSLSESRSIQRNARPRVVRKGNCVRTRNRSQKLGTATAARAGTKAHVNRLREVGGPLTDVRLRDGFRATIRFVALAAKRIASALLGVAWLASCSSSNDNPGGSASAPGTAAPSAVTASGPPPAPTPTPTPTLGLGEPIDLTCRDSASAGTPPDESDLTIAGLAFSGVSATDRTSAGDVELVSGAQTFAFRKVFVYATPLASPKTTLKILGPDTAAFFYQAQYAESGAMLQVSAADEIAASSRQVSFEGCGKATTGYIGGIIVSEPACIEIEVVGNGPEDTATTVVLPVLTDAC